MLQTKTHSIMFHHFHDIKHKPAQGSINSSTFRKILHWLMAKYTINGALEYKKKFDKDAAKKNLWMSEKDLTNLSDMGHTIGLHSYSHPTEMSKLSKSDQFLEYSKNLQHLRHILGKEPKTMSHLCGNYNKNTLEVLNSLGVTMGFKSNMPIGQIDSPLEIPRENHANIIVKMKHENNNIFE